MRWVLPVAVLLSVLFSALFASAAQLTVNAGTLQVFTFPVTIADFAPPECAGMTFDNLITGTAGDDHLNGGDGSQLILGFGGNDKITGGNGDDCIVGGDGDDDLHGGNGNDVILGGPDNDKIHGGDGNDHLYGGDGDDKIKGGADDDVIDGGPGSDECNGGAGVNTITNCEPPPGPTGLTALFHHSLPTVDLTWQLVADAAYYNVYQGIASGGPYEGIGSSRSPSFADTAIAEDATYYYVVTTVDADGFESGSSNEAQVVTLLAAPMPPAGPEATSTPTPWPTATPNPTPTPTPEPAPTPEPTPTPAS